MPNDSESGPGAHTREVPEDLERAWLAELQYWWGFYNLEYLDDELRPAQIRLAITRPSSESIATLATWNADARLYTFQPRHLLEDPWTEVLATLRHEMAHQYADEILGGRGEAPHGRLFGYAAERLRVDATASRVVSDRHASSAESTEQSRLLDRIGRLLSLGQSPNQNEAEVAIQKARQLLLQHNIDSLEQAEQRRFGVRALGPVKGRHQAWEYALGGLLSRFFFVEILWSGSFDAKRAKRGSVMEAYGTSENLAMAEYVYAYLTGLLGALWKSYKKARGLRSDRDRQTYYHGLIRGFSDKLREQERRAADQHALVWQGDPELTGFYRWHNPRIRTIKRGASRGGEAYADGKRDGREITLRKPLGDSGPADSSQRSLPG